MRILLERLQALGEVFGVDSLVENLWLFGHQTGGTMDMKSSALLDQQNGFGAAQFLLRYVFADASRSVPNEMIPIGYVSVWIIAQIHYALQQIGHGELEHWLWP